MNDLSTLETLDNYGFKESPFHTKKIEFGEGAKMLRYVNMAVKSNALVSICGGPGVGKSYAARAALKATNALVVHVRSAASPLIGDVIKAIILDASDEKPKRGKEIITRQVRRVLGEASRRQKVVVVIEEAHRLHPMTLKAIKSLRELDWMGKSPLFSVILIGQSDPMNRAGVSEVRLRSDSVYMRGMTPGEVIFYIENTLGNIFDDKTKTAISKLPESRNFLNLQSILISLMKHALEYSRRNVNMDDFNTIFGKRTKPTIKAPEKQAPKNEKKDHAEMINRALQESNVERNVDNEGRGLHRIV